MPPVNSPYGASPFNEHDNSATAPLRPITPLSSLSYLSSPVLDLASTLLSSHAENNADEDNVDFLRNSLDSLGTTPPRGNNVDPLRDPRRVNMNPNRGLVRSTNEQEAESVPAPRSTEDVTRRDRLQRVLSRLNRLHEPHTNNLHDSYSNHNPSRQSLYDWAPTLDEPSTPSEPELVAIVDELQRQQPDTHPEILRILAQSQLDGERDRGQAASERAARSTTGAMGEQRRRDELRSRAMLQRARREGSPGATERMLRFVMERERSGLSEEEERARAAGLYARAADTVGDAADTQHTSLNRPQDLDRDRDQRERIDAFRRGYLAEANNTNTTSRPARTTTSSSARPAAASSSIPRPTLPTSNTHLENALLYLSSLRNCSSTEEAFSAAQAHDLCIIDLPANDTDDFITDTSAVPPPAPSSWLQSGVVFEGCQHASSAHPPFFGLARARDGSGSVGADAEQINQHRRFDHPPGSTAFSAERPWLSHTPSSVYSHSSPSGTHNTRTRYPYDQWPVRVKIHSVDMEAMTLTGTMEAYDVPQHPLPSILSSSSLGGVAGNTADVNGNLNGDSGANTTQTSGSSKRGNRSKPITTYLEGEIIDLSTHSFLTNRKPNHKHPSKLTTSSSRIAFPPTTPSTDAHNWLKVPPLNSLPPLNSSAFPQDRAMDTICNTLLSTSHLSYLNEQFIFMRWKELAFVEQESDSAPCPPLSSSLSSGGNRVNRSSNNNNNNTACPPEPTSTRDRETGHGLTISGFYYVSLNRYDGQVRGVYYDPGGGPFQCLTLKGCEATGGSVGAWEFR